jgi:nitrite reductase/ring-hydroxylating ferredoxin subunit
MSTTDAPALFVGVADDHIRRRLTMLADEQGLSVVPVPAQHGPALAVLDLSSPGALDTVATWRERWPDTVIAGYLGEPDRTTWVEAQRRGADVVTTRGSLIVALRERLKHGGGAVRHRRFPLLDASDLAGRLGFVAAVDDTPVGPVGVYRVDGKLYAAADRCPHAGQRLCRGELDGAIVTCPGHGSRFDVRTGERVRGPADDDIETYSVVEDNGQLFLVVDAEPG